MPQHACSLFELQEFIRRVLALNLPEAVWVRAEIGQLKISRGHVYLDLVEKDDGQDDWKAQAPAVIWSSTMRQMRKTLGQDLQSLLQQGMEILIKARVDYHERFGFKLLIEEIDPAYTIGQLALAQVEKRRIIQAEGLVGKNSALPLPPALQRIAVISSIQAAGWQDFQKQLQENPYGYQFSYTLFPAAMQGAQLEEEIHQQLDQIRRRASAFDAVAILRGGGARLDLAGFDSVPLCRNIATFPIPVLTGIGHEMDETLLDLVAHTALKTPTALASFLIQHNIDFESQLLEYGSWLKNQARESLYTHTLFLQQQQQELKSLPLNRLVTEQSKLQQLQAQAPLHVRYILREHMNQLDTAQKICTLLSIENTLHRGFSITLLDGKPIYAATDLQSGDQITTQLPNGILISKIL